METSGSMQNNDNQKKGAWRTWTTVEKEALLSILEILVLHGYHCDNGSFKSGTYTLIEKELQVKCLNSGLKGTHILSQKWKYGKSKWDAIWHVE